MRKRDIVLYVIACTGAFLIVPAAMVFLKLWWPEEITPWQSFATVLGGCCSAVGALFIFWAIRELWVKGRGCAGVFGKIKLQQETVKLVTTGPYALCRNPMHMGLMLFYLGVACAINSLICLLVPVAVWIFATAFAFFLDEPRLKRDFGEEYEKWAQSVPRFFPDPKRHTMH